MHVDRLRVPDGFHPWTRFLACVRTILALSTLSTLVLTPTPFLFQPLAGMEDSLVCDDYTRLGLYCVLGEDRLDLGVWVSVGVLLLVISGFLPMLTAPLHLYVCWSFTNASTIPDGGDQIAVFLAFFLALVSVGDLRWNHWQRPRRRPSPAFLVGLAYAGLLAAKLQMSFLYLNSAIGKMAQEEWANGTHMYYTSFGYFAPGGWRGDLFDAIVTNPVLTFAMAWGVVVLEFALGLMLMFHGRERMALFAAGVALHLGIAFWLSIASFQVAMLAGLLLLAVPSTSVAHRRENDPEARTDQTEAPSRPLDETRHLAGVQG